VTEVEREKRTVFGEVAAQYDERRPGYPDAVFDTIIAYGELRAGDRALEVGAGTGKATAGFVTRGLDVLALEPSDGMARVLAAKRVRVETTSFEDWTVEPATFRLVFAAQSWHWVSPDGRYEKVAAALAPGGTLALFWNKPREFDGGLGAEMDAVYERHAPALRSGTVDKWGLDATLDEIAATSGFGVPEKRTVTWTQRYTTAEYVGLQETHSDHRMLPEDQRQRLHAAVSELVDAHGGEVDVIYDVELYLALRLARTRSKTTVFAPNRSTT
jgi:SAM-dependent methyltransferase